MQSTRRARARAQLKAAALTATAAATATHAARSTMYESYCLAFTPPLSPIRYLIDVLHICFLFVEIIMLEIYNTLLRTYVCGA